MADQILTDLSALTTPADGDFVYVVDVSDTTDDAAGSSKKITLQDLINLVLPTGSEIMWPTATAPTGWLLCNGAAVSRTTYAALFAVIGTTWGAGNGSTTFNVPDYRSRSPMGAGDGGAGLTNRILAAAVGAETHTLTTAELPSHNHGSETTNFMGLVAGSGIAGGGTFSGPTSTVTSNTGSGNAHANVHPCRITNFIIKHT